jgi:hypothetical protein
MTAIRGSLLVAALALTAACGGGGGDGGGGGPTPGTAEWTVMVYMAADNSLAVQGILDLDEMEDAGVDSRINVVTQAEFSPTVLAQYQCNASCFNRPNFNTFRYAITQNGGSAQNGPDRGPVQDIGNVDMTNPGTLQAFVAWAKQNYPANRYLLVLWNHGGGYTGLIQDETTAGSGLMSVEDLKTALTAAGPVDVVDFDMCLMAGYETLVKLQGLAGFAVFSEEVVPGEGNPYTPIINGLQANPTADGRAVASLIVNQFHAAYVAANDKSSTTHSAYDLTGFAAFDQALGTFATALTNAIPAEAANIAAAAAASQKYSISELTDVVNFLDSLDANVADVALKAQIAALKTQATAANFRINHQRRNGSGTGQQAASDVLRSTGLHLVMPSGQGNDVFNASGTRSLAAYQALYPGRPWTSFLTTWVTGQGQVPTQVVDQGDQGRLETYLLWDPNAIPVGADVDFWVLEPDGNLYIPAFGSVTPNGTLSNDSYQDGVNFEGYLTNRIVQVGEYRIYANLWADPQDFQPLYDLAYRDDQTQPFVLLFGPGNQPTLSLVTSWLDDPTPTLAEVEAGAYTDLQYVAIATFPAPPAPAPLFRRPGEPLASAAGVRRAEITAAQIATVRRLTAERTRSESQPARRLFGKPMPFPDGGR